MQNEIVPGKAMSDSARPGIVLCHGLWFDGSCFSRVIPLLQAAGYEVLAAQYGLDTPEADVAAVKRTLDRIEGPTILVGHSYGGRVITAAGNDDRVAGVVYIAALAQDADGAMGVEKFTPPDDVTEIDSSHSVMLSHPSVVVDVIVKACETAPPVRPLRP